MSLEGHTTTLRNIPPSKNAPRSLGKNSEHTDVLQPSKKSYDKLKSKPSRATFRRHLEIPHWEFHTEVPLLSRENCGIDFLAVEEGWGKETEKGVIRHSRSSRGDIEVTGRVSFVRYSWISLFLTNYTYLRACLLTNPVNDFQGVLLTFGFVWPDSYTRTEVWRTEYRGDPQDREVRSDSRYPPVFVTGDPVSCPGLCPVRESFPNDLPNDWLSDLRVLGSDVGVWDEETVSRAGPESPGETKGSTVGCLPTWLGSFTEDCEGEGSS